MFRPRVWARAQGIAAMHRNYNIAIEFSGEGRLNKISISRESLPSTPARQPATDSLPSSPLSDQSCLTPWFRKTASMTPVDNHSRPQSTPRSYRHHQLMDRSHEHLELRSRASSTPQLLSSHGYPMSLLPLRRYARRAPPTSDPAHPALPSRVACPKRFLPGVWSRVRCLPRP